MSLLKKLFQKKGVEVHGDPFPTSRRVVVNPAAKAILSPLGWVLVEFKELKK